MGAAAACRRAPRTRSCGSASLEPLPLPRPFTAGPLRGDPPPRRRKSCRRHLVARRWEAGGRGVELLQRQCGGAPTRGGAGPGRERRSVPARRLRSVPARRRSPLARSRPLGSMPVRWCVPPWWGACRSQPKPESEASTGTGRPPPRSASEALSMQCHWRPPPHTRSRPHLGGSSTRGPGSTPVGMWPGRGTQSPERERVREQEPVPPH